MRAVQITKTRDTEYSEGVLPKLILQQSVAELEASLEENERE